MIVLAAAFAAAALGRAVKKRTLRQYESLSRFYESRLLTACFGDYAEVERLLRKEIERRPRINRLEAAKRAYTRLRKRRAAAWKRAELDRWSK